MSRPVIEVELCGPGSLVRGHEARALVEAVLGRPPVWIPRLRGWSCQEANARDVVALAESRGIDVLITGPRTREERLRAALDAAPPPRWHGRPDPAGGLW